MESIITVDGVSVSYSNIEAINNISLSISKGEFVSVIGPNGGGKTTLLNTILGFLKPDKGKVFIFNQRIEKAYSKISYVPQTAALDRDFPITVIETVMTAFLKSSFNPFKKFSDDQIKKAAETLSLVGLSEKKDKLVSELSGGEFQRMLIARAIASDPSVLLLDEPTANVDIKSRNSIFSLLKELNQKGLTIVIVTHDLTAAKEFSNRIIYVNQEILYDGEPDGYNEV